MAAGDLIDRHFHLRSGYSIQLGHKVCDSSLLEDCLNADVIPFRVVETQELITRKAGIPVDNFLRHAVQWNTTVRAFSLIVFVGMYSTVPLMTSRFFRRRRSPTRHPGQIPVFVSRTHILLLDSRDSHVASLLRIIMVTHLHFYIYVYYLIYALPLMAITTTPY